LLQRKPKEHIFRGTSVVVFVIVQIELNLALLPREARDRKLLVIPRFDLLPQEVLLETLQVFVRHSGQRVRRSPGTLGPAHQAVR